MLCFFRWEKAAFKWNDKNLLIKDENILSGGIFSVFPQPIQKSYEKTSLPKFVKAQNKQKTGKM